MNINKKNKVFITLSTKKEIKHYVLYKTFENETDSNIICSFLSSNVKPKSNFQIYKSYEFNEGVFIPHFNIVEMEFSIFENIEKEKNNGKS